MIVTCENCHKRYLVKDEEIGPKGRKVRCVSCDYQWLQKPLDSIAIEGMKPSEFISPTTRANVSSPSHLSWGWISFILFFSFLLSTGYFGRYEVVHIWPKVAQFYESIGIEVARIGSGLKIENVQSHHLEKEEEAVLILQGDILNTSSMAQIIPPLKIQLLGPCENAGKEGEGSSITVLKQHNPQQCILKEWRHNFAESRLLPGERIAFETQPEVTIPSATNFRVQF